MREMWLCLQPGGLLLLAVPTCRADHLIFPNHRMYGPLRFARLVERWHMLGRVWDGKLVRGGLKSAAADPSLWQPNCIDWKHQQVVVLQKPWNARERGAAD